jgi:two-component system response regulator FixJ
MSEGVAEPVGPGASAAGVGSLGHVLVAEDDELVRVYIAQTLRKFGYRVTEVADALTALKIINSTSDVDLLLTDIVMPGGMNGWELAERGRAAHPSLKVLFTSSFVAQIEAHRICDYPHFLAKPYRPSQLEAAVTAAIKPPTTPYTGRYGGAYLYVIDGDSAHRRSMAAMLNQAGFTAHPYMTRQDFLSDAATLRPGCVILNMVEADCIEIIQTLGQHLARLPFVVLAEPSDFSWAVRAMKIGASDVLERPFSRAPLLATLDSIFVGLAQRVEKGGQAEHARQKLAKLTARQSDILQGLVDGLSNKQLAFRLNLSVRTIEVHRFNMMEQLRVKTLPDALRVAFDAGMTSTGNHGGNP